MAFHPYLFFSGTCRHAGGGRQLHGSRRRRGHRVFQALVDGGEVTMPMAETFWSPMFGMCLDRFGTPWLVNVETPAGS